MSRPPSRARPPGYPRVLAETGCDHLDVSGMNATSTAYSGTSATSIKIISRRCGAVRCGAGRCGAGRRGAVGGGLGDGARQTARRAIRIWLRDPVRRSTGQTPVTRSVGGGRVSYARTRERSGRPRRAEGTRRADSGTRAMAAAESDRRSVMRGSPGAPCRSGEYATGPSHAWTPIRAAASWPFLRSWDARGQGRRAPRLPAIPQAAGASS